MTSYVNACDVTVDNSNHKDFLYFFHMHLCPPNLKMVPPPMKSTKHSLQKMFALTTLCSSGLNEYAGCARICKLGVPFSIYTLWGDPIFSLRAFKILWDFFYDCIFII